MKPYMQCSIIISLLFIIQACKKTLTPVNLESTLKNTIWVGKWGFDFDSPDNIDSFYIYDNNKMTISMYIRSGQSFGIYKGNWRINGSTFIVDSAIEVNAPTAKLKCISSINTNKLEGIWIFEFGNQYHDGTFYVEKQ